jgi:hypothetical protein
MRTGGHSQKKKQKSAVKGAFGGKLLPGEKAKLKHERKEVGLHLIYVYLAPV